MKVKGIKCHRNKVTFMMAMAVSLATIVACGSQSAEKKSEAAAAPVVEENLIEDIVFNYNGIDFTMIAVDGGTFQMGATAEQSKSDKDEKPVHSVTLRNYYIGETEVTQELWIAVMGENPSHFGFGGAYPVDKINYNDCVAFINRLNELLADQLPAGRKFRLPTEAEWEFAARGGNYSSGYQFSGSDNIAEVAWYVDNTFYSPNIVKTMMPNELGIYDMSGNLYEWCSDFHDDKYYASSPLDNPTGPGVSGKRRVIRGGSWDLPWDHCRVSNRNRCPVDARGFSNGMRLALDADPDAKPVKGKTVVAPEHADKAVAGEKLDVKGVKSQLTARVHQLAADYNLPGNFYKKYFSSELYETFINASEKYDKDICDGGMFLDTQEHYKITAEINYIEVKSNTKASVSVSFIDSGYGKCLPRTIEFIYENGEWRVDDVVLATGETLRAVIIDILNSW